MSNDRLCCNKGTEGCPCDHKESALFVLLTNFNDVVGSAMFIIDDYLARKRYDAVRFAGPRERVMKVRNFLEMACAQHVYDWITLPYDCLAGGYSQLVVTRRLRLSAPSSSPSASSAAPRQLSEAVSKMTLQS